MYMNSIYEADIQRDEPAPDKVIRLQKTLGGAFNGVWTAWVRKAGSRQGLPWVRIHSDPKKNTVQLCEEFLRAWETAGYDAYKRPTVTEKYRSLLQRSARTRTPKGHDSDGRPCPWAASSRTAPTPPAPPDRTSDCAHASSSRAPSGTDQRRPWSKPRAGAAAPP
eukprot:7678117-Pyramimonas_sp.AAC.1